MNFYRSEIADAAEQILMAGSISDAIRERAALVWEISQRYRTPQSNVGFDIDAAVEELAAATSEEVG